jgi:hypothetical protein
MEGRRQSARVAIKLFPSGSNTFPECDAGALNVEGSRFCDHAILFLRSDFSHNSDDPRLGAAYQVFFPKAYNAPFAHANTG